MDTTALRALEPLPSRLRGRGADLPVGCWAGRLREDPQDLGPRRGRARRWMYVAAGGEQASVGAAVVDLGFLSVAFCWALIGARTVTFEQRRVLGSRTWVGRLPDGGAGLSARRARMLLLPDGGLELDVPSAAGRLRASVTTREDVTPMVLLTPTPDGGWNATEKAAGTLAEGWVRLGDGPRTSLGPEASGWRDWTSGRQDRTTTWRWAAGGGRSADGRRVGINVSTGMNGQADGEDVVWWDGQPYHLDVAHLRPEDELLLDGAWDVGGSGWSLHLDPAGARAEDVSLGLITSRYVQPIGRFTGTLPSPETGADPVWLAGVTEDHLAVW